MGWEREWSPLEAACRAFFAAIEAAEPASGPSAELVAAVFDRHLGSIDGEQLPLAARPGWEAALRLLKVVARPGRGPDPRQLAQALTALPSWPAARLRQLLSALGEMRRAIDQASDQRWNDTIREQVAKAYL